MLPNIIYRASVPDDQPFILDTFLQGAKSPTYGNMVGKVYYRRYQPILRELIGRSRHLVACLADDPNSIAGYVVYEYFDTIPVLHWLHVKSRYQGQGLGKALLANAIPSFGHSLTMTSHITRGFYQTKKRFHLEYDPFLTFGV